MTETRAPTATLVTVGNELLYGETVDTNAAWLGRSLAHLGIGVARTFTVGDDPDEIRAAVSAAMEGADLVLVSGGLGPTPDDLTKEAVADLLDREIILDVQLLEELAERFRVRGYDRLPVPNRSQAGVPAGATVLRNPQGTAPGLGLESGPRLIVMLPGVPRELRAIFDGDLSALLLRRFADRLQPIHHRTIRTTGVPESRLAELVAPLLPEDMGPLSLAFLPDLRGVDLRLTAKGVSATEAQDWFARLEGALEPAVSKWRFEAESGDIAEALNVALAAARMTVATAESCTGGLVAKRITDRPGSSEVFVGGVISYADAIKIGQLGVSPDDLRAHGAVSEPVARQMATGVRERFGASAAIGITGVAGPGGGSVDKPVGTVWVATAVRDAVEARLMSLPGDRNAVRERAAESALGWLYRRISGQA
jgi:nicotinamide-nucleotide amidase